MLAPDLEALEAALTTRLLALVNTAVTPNEPLLRSVFNLIDEANSEDETPHRMPSCGIMHESEPFDANELLGGFITQEGRESWKLVILCDSPKRDGGMRGKRGAYTVSKLVMEGIAVDTGTWQIAPGSPIQVDRRNRYSARNENGELLPISGYVLDISHPVIYEP